MQLVKEEMLSSDITTLLTYSNLDFSNYAERPKGLAPEDVLSPALLKDVGYKINAYDSTIDDPYPYSNPDFRDHIKKSRSGHYKAVYKSPRNTTTGGSES